MKKRKGSKKETTNKVLIAVWDKGIKPIGYLMSIEGNQLVVSRLPNKHCKFKISLYKDFEKYNNLLDLLNEIANSDNVGVTIQTDYNDTRNSEIDWHDDINQFIFEKVKSLV